MNKRGGGEGNIKSTLIIYLVAILAIAALVTYLSTVEEGGYIKSHTEEQVSIQEEEMEIIGRYDLGAFMIVWKIHDNRNNVTCWTTNAEGISCIPDHMLSP